MENKHLIGLEGYPSKDIKKIIDTAISFKEILNRPIKKVPSLQGRTIVNLFFENSTRTRISFEIAEKRLSADSVNFSASSSSLSKGETLKDTVKNIESMKIDAAIIRHPSPGAAYLLTNYIDSVVINAGDGMHEHPTQALLDMTSLYEKFGFLKNLKVGIIGDISHSRVALSNIHGLLSMGAKVTLCGPSTLMPQQIERLGVSIKHNFDEVIEWADALNILRIQRERMNKGLIPSVREYREFFGLSNERIKNHHSKEIIILHPGPINRGVEIDSEVADSDQSIILDQVLNGVATRMAVLFLLLGGKSEEKT